MREMYQTGNLFSIYNKNQKHNLYVFRCQIMGKYDFVRLALVCAWLWYTCR